MTTRKLFLTKVLFVISASLIMMLLLISTSSASAPPAQHSQDDPYRVEEFTIATPSELEVLTSGGNITVEGTNTNSVRVEMYVHKDGRNLLPEDEDLERWDIDISESGNAVRAIAKRSSNRGWSTWNKDRVSISFFIQAPTQISSDLKTSGGHIEVDGLEGNQSIRTSGGHLNLANLNGTIEAKTSGGHIELSNVEGEINTKTSGGHITVQTLSGTLEAKTSGGHIKLDNVSGSIKASTSGGSIKADLKTIGQYVELKTSGGNIDIAIPDNIGVDLKLKGTFVQGKLNNFSGEMKNNNINGQLNGGGPKVAARTSGGTVRLSFN